MLPRLDPSDEQERHYPVQENLHVQRRQWALERVGIWILGALVALTVAGLFAKGPLSHAEAASEDGRLQVTWQRFLRNGATSTLVVDVHGAGPKARVELLGELLEGSTLESLQPQPAASRTAGGNGLALDVKADEQGRVRLFLSLRADGVGLFRSQVRVGDRQVPVTQFIYP